MKMQKLLGVRRLREISYLFGFFLCDRGSTRLVIFNTPWLAAKYFCLIVYSDGSENAKIFKLLSTFRLSLVFYGKKWFFLILFLNSFRWPYFLGIVEVEKSFSLFRCRRRVSSVADLSEQPRGSGSLKYPLELPYPYLAPENIFEGFFLFQFPPKSV